MESGIHTWSIEIVKYCALTWVGVTCANRPPAPLVWLGKHRRGWAYGSHGAACHATGQDNGPYNCVHPNFGVGDVVTLTLDLTDGGVLHGAINDGESFVLFEKMKREGICQFAPAISLRKPGCVRLIRFNDLEFDI